MSSTSRKAQFECLSGQIPSRAMLYGLCMDLPVGDAGHKLLRDGHLDGVVDPRASDQKKSLF